MVECMEQMLIQLIECIPGFIGMYLTFRFIGELLFK